MEADCGHGLSLFKENCSECWREERDALQARVKELEESIKLYRGAIVESGDLKRENAKLRKVLSCAYEALCTGDKEAELVAIQFIEKYNGQMTVKGPGSDG